jgi:predicted transcriptional regulator
MKVERIRLPRGMGSDCNKLANTRDLTRILTYLSEVEYANVTKIFQKAMINTSKVKDAMTWLVNHGLVIKFKTYSKGMYFYKLK